MILAPGGRTGGSYYYLIASSAKLHKREIQIAELEKKKHRQILVILAPPSAGDDTTTCKYSLTKQRNADDII